MEFLAKIDMEMITAQCIFNAVDSYVEGINPGNNLPVGNSPRTFSAWIRNNQYNQYGSNIFHYGTQQAAPTNFHFLNNRCFGIRKWIWLWCCIWKYKSN